MVDFIGVLPPQILGQVNNHGGHNDDLIIAMENYSARLTLTRMLFNTLNSIGEIAPGFQRLDQIQKLISGLIDLSLDAERVVNRQNFHIGHGNIEPLPCLPGRCGGMRSFVAAFGSSGGLASGCLMPGRNFQDRIGLGRFTVWSYGRIIGR